MKEKLKITPEQWAELDFLMENYENDAIAFYDDEQSRRRFIVLHNLLIPSKVVKHSYPDCVNRCYYNIKNYNNG